MAAVHCSKSSGIIASHVGHQTLNRFIRSNPSYSIAGTAPRLVRGRTLAKDVHWRLVRNGMFSTLDVIANLNLVRMKTKSIEIHAWV